MAKVMLFIDGTWLYANAGALAESYGDKDFKIDFGKLPSVLKEEIADQLGGTEVDVVRTYLFGSYPDNCDPRDEDAVERKLDFFEMLKEEYHYELELFPINFRGKRLRKADRGANDTFEPKEKCVDIALATSMLYFAAIPYAYDIAVAVIGDQDFKPVLQHVRRLGKRVAIASIKGTCAPDYSDPRDEARVKDFDIIWLNDLLGRLALKYERRQVECESPNHRGERKVWTSYYVRRGQKFYCDKCRTDFVRQKREVAAHARAAAAPLAHLLEEHAGDGITYRSESADESVDNTSPSPAVPPSQVGSTLSGVIKKKIAQGLKKYGFIHADDAADYYFNITDLDGVGFDEIEEQMRVMFEVKRPSGPDNTGAATRVRPHSPALAGSG